MLRLPAIRIQAWYVWTRLHKRVTLAVIAFDLICARVCVAGEHVADVAAAAGVGGRGGGGLAPPRPAAPAPAPAAPAPHAPARAPHRFCFALPHDMNII